MNNSYRCGETVLPTSFIRSVLESHPKELRNTIVPIGRLAVLLHDSLTGDVLYRLLAGVGKRPKDKALEGLACTVGDVILGAVRKPYSVVDQIVKERGGGGRDRCK